MIDFNIEKLNKIGGTPLFCLDMTKSILNLNSNIYAKLEWYNPFGSIKDRSALEMIKTAVKEGKINEQTVIIEATSGNTGIAIAGIASILGLKAIICMPEGMSKERVDLILSYGEEVIQTKKEEGMTGAIALANRLAKEIPNSFICDQFNNPYNYKAHFQTGKEIYDSLAGNIDIFVAGVGTGGTITGIGKYLKSQNKDIKIVALEPEKSSFLTNGKKGNHFIQGIGAGFKPSILDMNIIDEIITIKDEDILSGLKLIKETENLMVGLSSVANYLGAIMLAKKYSNKNIVTVFSDDISKYYSVLK